MPLSFPPIKSSLEVRFENEIQEKHKGIYRWTDVSFILVVSKSL